MADKYPSTILPQTNDPQEIQKGNLDLLAKINEVAASGATSSSIPWTKEAIYVPTFTGFGTVTVSNFSWTRVGNRIKIMGKFTSGTPTAVEARMSLPVVDGVQLICDAVLIPSITVCGIYILNAVGTLYFTCLIEPSVGYITFSYQGNVFHGFTKENGNAITVAGSLIGLQVELPISGWN